MKHALAVLLAVLPALAAADSQTGTLFNTRTVSAVNTAVSATIAAAPDTRAHVYRITARCSAGTAALQIESPAATVLWDVAAAATHDFVFSTGWTGATNTAVVVTLAACGASNTGTLSVEADRW